MTTQRIALVAVLFFMAFACLSFHPVADFIISMDSDLLHKLRGDRKASDDVMLVYIDSQDVSQLGWPITRDYYGYAIHVLKQAGAKVIAPDVLFVTQSTRYPEFDEDLGHFAEIAGNVIVPFAFAHLEDTISDDAATHFLGDDPHFPFQPLQQHVRGMGFNNLADETVARHGLLTAVWNDSLIPSFGLECARQFLLGDSSTLRRRGKHLELEKNAVKISIPVDQLQRIRLNHFGSLAGVKSTSLVDLLQTFQASPDSLDLYGKLVFIGVTAPGTAPIKVTPLNAALPAVLLQLTIAENIISENFLRPLSPVSASLLTTVFAAVIAFFYGYSRKRLAIISSVVFLYLIASALIFKLSAIVLPLSLPFITGLTAFGVMLGFEYHARSREEAQRQNHYANEMSRKSKQLAAAQMELEKTRAQLRDIQQRSNKSAKTSEIEIDKKEKEIERLRQELLDLSVAGKKDVKSDHQLFPHIVRASDSPMADVLKMVEKVAPVDIPVLISGETGTGKEVISRAIHDSGPRQRHAFIAVNCGALSETLLESDLFGHEKGAFTGAANRRLGRFELADKGTLFLDEITETSANFQAKLLRVLQEGTFERLGGEKTIQVNVRVIAASSKNIFHQVQMGNFREDLYYRLNGFAIDIPPLRERREDIPQLAQHFLNFYNYENLLFSEAALKAMKNHTWPGNVRELENTVRRAALLAQSDGRDLIREIDLPELLRHANPDLNFKSFDKQVLESLRALHFSHASITQTAKALGNKDRGTIADYLRGICYEVLAKSKFDIKSAAREIAQSRDARVIERVETKINNYVSSIKTSTRSALLKGLPKKYHDFLNQVIRAVDEKKL